MQRPARPWPGGLRALRRWSSEAALVFTAIGLALAVWFAIADAQNREVEQRLGFSLPVGVINTASDLAVANEPLPVSVTVAGRQEDVAAAGPDDFQVTVDLGGRARGRHSLPVRVDSLLDGVRVRSIQPETAVVQVEQVEERVVPVRVETFNPPPLGFSAGEPQSTPREATITGISADVGIVDEVVARLDLAGATVPVDRSVPLEARTAAGVAVSRVVISPPFAQARVDVTQELFTRTLAIRPRVEGRPRAGYRIAEVTVEPSVVDIVVTLDAFEGDGYVDTRPVNVAGRAATVRRSVALDPSAGEAAADTVVVVVVEIEPIVAEAAVPVIVRLGEPPDGLEASLVPVAITAAFRGPVDAAALLGSSAVSVEIDLSDLAEGRHELAVEVEPPPGMELIRIEPAAVTVELRPIEESASESEEAAEEDGG